MTLLTRWFLPASRVFRPQVSRLLSLLCGGLFLSPLPASVPALVETARSARTESDPYPLPLAGHWTTGVYPEARGWRPQEQLRLIREGHYLLPWFQMPYPEGWSPGDSQLIKADFLDYLPAFEECRKLGLPISFVSTQWDAVFSDPSFRDLPPEQNPNVVLEDGSIIGESDPFGPVEQWKELGRRWTSSESMKKLQELYPNPPLVIFLSNNERARLVWNEAEKARRYLEKYGQGRSDDFKRKVIAEGWIERHRALQEGMREGLVSEAWKKNARFVGYDAFGPVFLGRWPGWMEYSLYSSGEKDPFPLMWDGASPSYYTSNWNESTDFRVYSPQIESMNWVFQLRKTYEANPQFWFELSIWDGYMGGTPKPLSPDDKRTFYKNLGQDYTPERYAGYVQYGMWLLRPRLVREFRMHNHYSDEGMPYFFEVVKAVDRVHNDPELSSWWKEGTLVPNSAREHPYQANIPPEFAQEPRWFLLDADCNPSDPLTAQTEIPVFSLALSRGSAPQREWLVYAHAPLGPKKNVTLTIPGYGPVTVDVPVQGAFYRFQEADRSTMAISH